MRTSLLFTIVLCALSLGLFMSNSDLQAQWVSAYYAGWQQGNSNNGYLPAQNVDYSAVTHIIHFALVPQSNGSLDDQGNSVNATNASALISAAHAKGVKVIICVGGWNTESAFMSATGSGTRATFVSNLVNLMKSRGYDGIDVDWEPLSSGDASNYSAFITDLRNALNAVSPRPLLTMATQWTASISAQVASQMDQINLMTYDLAGAWPGWVSWHNSATVSGTTKIGSQLISCDDFVNAWSGAGVPLAKLGIGIDFYGYVWNGYVNAPNQSWTTAPNVTSNVAYHDIMDQYYSSSSYHWDANAQASYLGIGSQGSSSAKFISYDDQSTISAKFSYTRSKHIGGLIIWELGGGYRANQPAGQQDLLLQAVKQQLGGGSGPTIPATPSLASPSNGASGIAVNPTLSWNASSGAASYGLQVSTSSSFASTVVNQTGLSTTLFAASGLLNATTYYWRVNATNSAGTSAWSGAYSFSTVTAPVVPPAPVLASPANGATGIALSPTLTWNASTGATSYGVQVSTSSSFASTVVNQTGLSGTSYAASGLLNGTTYYWRVNATNSVGTSAWSSVSNFITSATALPNIALNKPASASSIESSSYPASYAFDGSMSTRWSTQYSDPQWLSVDLGSNHNVDSVVLIWEVAYGKAYSIQTSLDGVTWTSAYSTTTGAGGTNIIRITPTVARYVRMYGTQRGTVWGYSLYEMQVYEAPGALPVAPSAPTLASPVNGATGIAVNPLLSWNVSTGATSYHVQLSTGAAFSTTVVDQNNITTTSLGASGLSNSTMYYWRVSASNAGGTSAWSTTSSFTTIASSDTTHPTVAVTAPVNGATVSGTVNVTANASDNVGVVGVQFQIDGTNAGSEATTAPYGYAWNTTLVSNGTHTVSAIARDAAGNKSTSSVSVIVSNTISTTTDLSVYFESLQSPWVNSSWNATITFNSTDQQYAGSYSVKVAQGTWGGLSLHYGNWGGTAINTASYSTVEFAVYGGASGANIYVMFENDPGNSFPKVSAGTVAANTWKLISVPISQLNPSNYGVNRLDIMEMSGAAKTYYVDNLRFVGASLATEQKADASLETESTTPKAFALAQNYPNPFNPTTLIKYMLPADAHVTMEVYNTLGQRVMSLVNEVQGSGEHEVVFNASELPSGVYFYRLTARTTSGDQSGNFVETKRMMLLK